MIRVLRSEERGQTRFAWLDSRHTFSFGDYYDAKRLGFRSLRVLNEDRVFFEGGFPPHPHRNMEILTYVISGSLEHEDNMGNGRVIRAGELQMMGAGTGIVHSEFNPSDKEEVHFLQIWIKSKHRNTKPRYAEWRPKHSQKMLQLLASQEGKEKSVVIDQDVFLYLLRLDKNENLEYEIAARRGCWMQVFGGEFAIHDVVLGEGDGAAIEDERKILISAKSKSEALLFDLK